MPAGPSNHDAQRAAANMGLRLRRECGLETQRSESSRIAVEAEAVGVGEAVQEKLEERDEQKEDGA